MSNITESINTFDIVNKTLGLAKTGLGKLVFPLKSKYIAERIIYFNPYTTPRKGNTLLVTMFSAIYFNTIFKGVYKELKIFEQQQDGEAPKNDIYYRKLDMCNIVIMIIYPIVEIDKDNEIHDTKVSRTLFIGPDCEKWKTFFSIKAARIAEKYASDRWTPDNKNIFITSRSNFDNTTRCNTRAKTFDDIVMKNKDELISFVDKFIKNESVYEKNNIPYRLGALFFGPPGTGKSSLAYTIANHTHLSVVTITQEFIFKIETGDAKVSWGMWDSVVVLLDEIDSFLSTDQTNNRGILRKEQLFSFIDKLPEGSILVATTNHIDKLDDALTRSGRFDIKMEMKYFDKEDAEEMISRFEVDPSFINRYPDNEPIRPSDLQFDLVQEISKNILS